MDVARGYRATAGPYTRAVGLFERKRVDQEPSGGGASLHIDLDERVCPLCRRDLSPWHTTCPDDGAATVLRGELPALNQPPAHLLRDLDDELDDEDDPDDEVLTDDEE